ncbi:peptidylprolyl isomerase [Marinimicrobium agarilyticum]|uniref:peptidylprolyl isomerase n=1 Tax=Marinimicrobium agarilyticum TaxID=306546 RepID=UPI0003FFC189|nr:peptidylprolyl isomerase [Marinimicrobium agarilyticum]
MSTASKVTLHTDYGDITIELNHEKAPKTAANFAQYAQEGFYDDTIFHRVISNFMVQGGGMTEDMQQKPTRAPIENEADNGLGNVVGSVAMARTSDPHSASAQFFINVQDNSFLNHRDKSMQGWGYCVFGKVAEGMDTVNKIKAVKTGSKGGHQDVPVDPVMIKKVTVSE